MSETSFYSKVSRILSEFEPAAAKHFQGKNFELKFSPYPLELPRKILDRAQSCVRSLYHICHTKEHLARVRAALPESRRWVLDVRARPTSALMAYDFHSDSGGRLHLIEVNTNASSFLLADALYRAHELPPAGANSDPRLEILNTFRSEFAPQLERAGGELQVAIVDEAPERQAMFAEFLLFSALFRRAGWGVKILDLAELKWRDGCLTAPDGARLDAVYCRSTDFYYESEAARALKEAYRLGTATVTPHPREYALLSEKSRLLELSRPGALIGDSALDDSLATLRACLIPSFSVNDFSSTDEVWQRRKSLFFKPRSSFGGKSVYRGESISRKVFDRMLESDPILQTFVPAPVDDSGWKFDLRFFVYQDQIQLAVARRYQGQVTNFNTPGGGLSAIKWT